MFVSSKKIFVIVDKKGTGNRSLYFATANSSVISHCVKEYGNNMFAYMYDG